MLRPTYDCFWPVAPDGRPDRRALVGSDRRWTGHGASTMNAPQMTLTSHSLRSRVASVMARTDRIGSLRPDAGRREPRQCRSLCSQFPEELAYVRHHRIWLFPESKMASVLHLGVVNEI